MCSRPTGRATGSSAIARQRLHSFEEHENALKEEMVNLQIDGTCETRNPRSHYPEILEPQFTVTLTVVVCEVTPAEDAVTVTT